MQKLTTSTAAAALRVDTKALDNILVKHAGHLMASGEHGKSRHIPLRVLEQVAVALVLKRDADIPIGHGLRLAARLIQSDASDTPLGRYVLFRFKLDSLRASLQQSIADVIEQTVPPERGRPRVHHKRSGALQN